jgi:hypothetical protein
MLCVPAAPAANFISRRLSVVVEPKATPKDSVTFEGLVCEVRVMVVAAKTNLGADKTKTIPKAKERKGLRETEEAEEGVNFLNVFMVQFHWSALQCGRYFYFLKSDVSQTLKLQLLQTKSKQKKSKTGFNPTASKSFHRSGALYTVLPDLRQAFSSGSYHQK